jgi:diguanylate cyclase (GGDEF)-like protein
MAHLFVEDGKKRTTVELLPDVPGKVGRALQGAVVLEDGAASREHCLIERTPRGWQLRDLKSRNGTRLNGRIAADEPVLLRPGDRIEIGAACLTFAGEGEEGARAARALEAASRSREASNASTAALAQDSLTGLASFPLLVHELKTRLGAAGPDETALLRPLGLLLADVDGLGLVNDVFGFRPGDELIRAVGLEIQAATSERLANALVAREGGGTFGVLAPGLDAATAVELGEAIRTRVARRALEGQLREAGTTVSVGVASAPEDASAWRELLRRAEAALARAKREGRDRVARPPSLRPATRQSLAASGLFATLARADGDGTTQAGEAGADPVLGTLLKKKSARSALAVIANAFGSDLELDALLKLVLAILLEKTDARRGLLMLRDARTDELRLAERLDRDPSAARGEKIDFSHGILREALASPEPIVVEDALADARFKRRQSVVLGKPRSVLAAAIAVPGSDGPLGVIYLDDRSAAARFTKEHRELVRAVARLIAGPVRRWARSERAEAELAQARALLERTAEAESLRYAEHKGLLGESAAMRELHRAIDRVAASDVPVAISGESGSGKELVARAIHAASARASGPFVAESTAALTDTLLEAELFGHARGAFTGAESERAGLFETASGGTLFLDEVGEMSPSLQAKLLRVLQQKEVRRIGEELPRKVDVRLITATNKDLEKLVEHKLFRKDLLYRIRVLTVDVPPLRERREDIPALLDRFLADAAPGGRAPRVSKVALARLVHYDWPGNVRELENEAKKLASLGAAEIGTEDLSPGIRGEAASGRGSSGRMRIEDGAQAIIDACEQGRGLYDVLEAFEREAIGRVLAREGGNRTVTARKLGITRQGLHKKLKRYGFDT